MSDLYPDLTLTSFPASTDDINRIVDVTSDLLTYVKLYQSYYSAGNLASAQQVLEDYPALEKCFIGASTINPIIDAVKAIQRFYMSDVQEYLVEIVKPMGTWSSTTKYSKYNTVQYTVNSVECTYMCISTDCSIGTKPTDTDYWIALTLKGEQGASGVGLSPRGAWDKSTTYYENDLVSYNNCLWGALSDHTGKTPSSTSSYWFLVMDYSGSDVTYDDTNTELGASTVQEAIETLAESIEGKSDENHTHLYAGSTSAGGDATTVTTSSDTSSTLCLVGVSSSATNKLKYNTGVTIGANCVNATTFNGTATKVKATSATTTKAYVAGVTGTGTTPIYDTGVYLDATSGKLVATTFSGTLSGSADMVDNCHVSYDVANTFGLRQTAMSTSEITAGTTSLAKGCIYIQYES